MQIEILVILAVTVDTAKILMMPANINSHALMFANLGKELADVGNQIQMLMPSNNKMTDIITQSESFTIIRYQVEEKTQFSSNPYCTETLMKNCAGRFSLDEIGTDGGNGKAVYFGLRERMRIAIREPRFDQEFTRRWILVRYHRSRDFSWGPFLGSKNAGNSIRSVAFPITWLTDIARVPRLPSFFPIVGMGSTNEMPFFHRLISFLLTSGRT